MLIAEPVEVLELVAVRDSTADAVEDLERVEDRVSSFEGQLVRVARADKVLVRVDVADKVGSTTIFANSREPPIPSNAIAKSGGSNPLAEATRPRRKRSLAHILLRHI